MAFGGLGEQDIGGRDVEAWFEVGGFASKLGVSNKYLNGGRRRRSGGSGRTSGRSGCSFTVIIRDGHADIFGGTHRCGYPHYPTYVGYSAILSDNAEVDADIRIRVAIPSVNTWVRCASGNVLKDEMAAQSTCCDFEWCQF